MTSLGQTFNIGHSGAKNLDFCFQLVVKSSVAFYYSRGDVGMAKKIDSEILIGDINTSLINFCKSSEILLLDRIPFFQLVMLQFS